MNAAPRTEAPAAADALPPVPEQLAAIDLGSNSFHLVIGKVVDGHVDIVDRLREPVRLAAGPDERKRLGRDAIESALDCQGILDRFQNRFEDALAALHEGLSALGLHRHHRPQHRKALALRQRRVAPIPILGLALDALAVGEVLPRIARPVQPVGDEVHPHALGAHPRVVHHLKLHPAPSTEVRLVQRRAISETITGHGT